MPFIAMRKLQTPWTDADIELLKKLHAAGASAIRASLALKKNKTSVRQKARQLGIPFLSVLDRKRQQAKREQAALPVRSKS